MKATRTVKWQKDGRQVEVKIERTLGIIDKEIDLDGDRWTRKEAVDRTYIEVFVNGKHAGDAFGAPHVITEEAYTNYDKITANGGYARLGDGIISEESYTMIMVAIKEMEEELTAKVVSDKEYIKIKAAEVAKEKLEEDLDKREAERMARAIKSGYCTKCHSYCYGDCEAN